MKRFFGRIGGWLALIACIGLGVYFVVSGANMLSVEMSGEAASVTISHCESRPTRSRWGTCSAVWPQGDGTQKTVTVEGSSLFYGKTVAVHVRGDHGYADGSWTLSLLSGIVLVALWPVVWLIGRSRRAKPPQL